MWPRQASQSTPKLARTLEGKPGADFRQTAVRQTTADLKARGRRRVELRPPSSLHQKACAFACIDASQGPLFVHIPDRRALHFCISQLRDIRLTWSVLCLCLALTRERRMPFCKGVSSLAYLTSRASCPAFFFVAMQHSVESAKKKGGAFAPPFSTLVRWTYWAAAGAASDTTNSMRRLASLAVSSSVASFSLVSP
jgi:hypothetical protein